MEVAVKQIVDEELRRLQFQRAKHGWYRHAPDVVHVVGLQKSQWGNSYYLNLGIWLQTVAATDAPKPSKCHLQCRIDVLAGTPAELSEALTEEDYWRMDSEQRHEVFDVSDGRLSQYWLVGDDRSAQTYRIIVAYPEWANDPYYYDRLTDGEPAAVDTFGRYRKLIDAEYRSAVEP